MYNVYADHAFCVRLKELLAERSETIYKFSKDSGVSRHSATNYYYGIVLPGAYNLMKVADYFGVSADYLLGRTDRKEVNR